jgi:hypothetical protein
MKKMNQSLLKKTKNKILYLGTQIFVMQCNTVVSNHFHSVKNFLFSSAKPHDFDGMLGTGLPVSIYITKTPINKCHFNVTQLKEFFTFSVKDRYQLNYFICIKGFNAQTTRGCTLRRAKNTPTRSFVSRTVNRK